MPLPQNGATWNLGVATTGASDSIFLRQLLRICENDPRIGHVNLIASDSALRVMAEELDLKVRSNLVEQLLYKAIFAEATSRAHFVALLLGRTYDPAGDPGEKATVEEVLAHAEKNPPDEAAFATIHARLRAAIEKDLPLDAGDKRTLEVTHRAFLKKQLALRFELKPANGIIGYVPTEEAFARGGYECTLSMGSKLDPSAARLLTQAALDVLTAVADKSDSPTPSGHPPA